MIPRLGSIIEKRTAGAADYVLKLHVGIFGSFYQTVKIVDIGLFVFPIMKIDCFLRNSRCQFVGSVW